MVTEISGVGASRSDIILGSGLSGMVAAYIRARAQEDNASQDETWSAQMAFRPRARAWRANKVRPKGGGAAAAS
jgi:hypothetical protein